VQRGVGEVRQRVGVQVAAGDGVVVAAVSDRQAAANAAVIAREREAPRSADESRCSRFGMRPP
jgi:hypothetical protein